MAGLSPGNYCSSFIFGNSNYKVLDGKMFLCVSKSPTEHAFESLIAKLIASN